MSVVGKRVFFSERIFILLILGITILPSIMLNHNKDAISEIDNRALAPNPFSTDVGVSELPGAIKAYYSDRIGFRNEMILAYTECNDVLFDEMVHPIYMYGKNGHVFFKAVKTTEYSEYHEAFIKMLSEIQEYCDKNGTPFVFVFEPSKASVYTEQLPIGWNYDKTWVDTFIRRLDEEEINYVDNTETMLQKKAMGDEVFNVKYDAGHWNDLGAFYGMNAVIDNLNDQGMTIRRNEMSDFKIGSKLETTLLVSEFPICENVPYFDPRIKIRNDSEKYSDQMSLDDTYNAFYYFVNETRMAEGAPRVLAFTGSYINVYGKKFLGNSFGEYIGIHSYQNILDFKEYYEMFDPDCVIFDAAEFSFQGDANQYYDHERMKEFKL